MSRDSEFEAFVGRFRPTLVRTATGLTGDPHLAEDVVQTALVKLYLAWGRAARGSLEAYTRRIVVNCVVDHSRRSQRREDVVEDVPDRPVPPDGGHLPPPGPEGDDVVLAALATLPIGMRTAVVLRHVEGLDVEETAAAMGCSAGNVKSQTARGLARLRARLDRSRSEGAPR